MSCCICELPGECAVAHRMAHRLDGLTSAHASEPRELNNALAEAGADTVSRIYTYTMHGGRCEALFAHLAGWHARKPALQECAACADAKSVKELRKLSPETKGFIYHRLRNPLAIILGFGELVQGDGDNRGTRITEAAARINREFREILEGS